MYILHHTMFGCSNKAKSTAFSALILPIPECASPVWSPHSMQNTNLLESLLYHGACWACMIHYTISGFHLLQVLWTLHWPSLYIHCDMSFISYHASIVDPVFLSIFCLLLSGHFHNINLSSVISYHYSFCVRHLSCGISRTLRHFQSSV